MKNAEAYRLRVDDFLLHHLQSRAAQLPVKAGKLLNSVQYSLMSGGKRFRPLVCALAAEALNCSFERVVPFAAALEMIHTYSLIHDDLPCMDDDDLRRGQPTNHRVYGEATALLAGDALLTEAFYVLSRHFVTTPEVGIELTAMLSEAAGLSGMVVGQILDMASQDAERQATATESESKQGLTMMGQQELVRLHELKTGELIRVAARGVAEIARTTEAKKQALNNCGQKLGLSFQLVDDILDYEPNALEASGFPKLIGIEGTKNLLSQTTQSALNELELFGPEAQGLRDLIEYNLKRKI